MLGSPLSPQQEEAPPEEDDVADSQGDPVLDAGSEGSGSTATKSGPDGSPSDATDVQESVAIAVGLQRWPAGHEGDVPVRHCLRRTVHLHSGASGAPLRRGRPPRWDV